MAALGVIATIVGAGVSLMGTIASANAQKQQAEKEARALEMKAEQDRQIATFKAKQETERGHEARAVAGREAMETRRREEHLQSTLRARAAADGGLATDPTIVKLGEGIAARGEYDALLHQYKGENAARGFEDTAMATLWTAESSASAAKETAAATRRGGRMAAQGTLLSGIGGMAGKVASAFG